MRHRSLVFVVTAAFVWSLGLPQVGTLHHDHVGGDHAHVHAEFADSPFVLLHSHHDEPRLPHPHPHAHEHSHPEAKHSADSQHPHHHGHSTITKKSSHPELAYHTPTSSHGGHWHALNVFHHATPTPIASLLPSFSCLPFPAFPQIFLFTSTLPFCHPRAPPMLL